MRGRRFCHWLCVPSPGGNFIIVDGRGAAVRERGEGRLAPAVAAE
jgi:hypothetical protein